METDVESGNADKVLILQLGSDTNKGRADSDSLFWVSITSFGIFAEF